MRISDWSSDVCSSDLRAGPPPGDRAVVPAGGQRLVRDRLQEGRRQEAQPGRGYGKRRGQAGGRQGRCEARHRGQARHKTRRNRSEEHTSELQSLMRISYAVFCLKKKTKQAQTK